MITVQPLSPTSMTMNARMSMWNPVWVGAALLKAYCRISLFKLLSFWTETKICDWDESLESKDKDALSPGHYEHCVGGWEQSRGQKAWLLCMDSELRASRLALHLAESSQARERSNIVEKQLSEHYTNSDCYVRVRGVSVEFSDPVNEVHKFNCIHAHALQWCRRDVRDNATTSQQGEQATTTTDS